jgi:hypothetical protein
MRQEGSLSSTCDGPARLQTDQSTPNSRTAQRSAEQRGCIEGKTDRSLCCTCVHAPTCTYRQRSEGPVFFCEEFEVETREPAAPATVDDRQSAQAVAVQHAQEPASNYLGLCSNCEHRDTCRLPKPEGGVWHCEEYS